VNVGVVGCGRVTALRHLPALRRADGVRAVALADLDTGRAAALAREHGLASVHERYEDLIAASDVDAVAVCIPAALHAEVVVAALEVGKHVLVEKPLALSLEDADRIGEAASDSHSVVMIGLNLRHHRLLRRARDLVLGGVLGELQAVRTAFTSSFDYRATAAPWRLRREHGGGAVGEMAPHHLDLWRFLTGLEIQQVFATSSSSRDEDDTAIVTGVLASGVRAETLVSQRSTNVNEVEVFGELGRLRVSCYRSDGLELQLGRGFGGDVRQRLGRVTRAAKELPAFVRGLRGGSDYVESYVTEWTHFAAAAAGRVPADASLEDGIRNVEVLCAALESLDSGRAVQLSGPRAKVGS
jgi:myo-inositol 2-dehydrogenase / D-chiro-inositol 1-dehydrogenase